MLLNLCEAERHREADEIATPFLDGVTDYPRDSVWLPAVASVALVAVELGAPCRTWLREQLSPDPSPWSCWGSLGSVAPVATVLGRLDASLGDPDAAEHLFAEAIAHCREHESPWFLADALLYRGRARAEAGAPFDQVEAPLREALALARVGGYGTIARRAQATLDGS